MELLRPTPAGFVPTPAAAGPWGPATLAGQVVTGLVGHQAEHVVDADTWRGARVTVDLVRMTSLAPVTGSSSLVHESRRLLLVDVELCQEEQVVARGRATFVPREGAGPQGQVWTSRAHMPPPPGGHTQMGQHPFAQLRAYAGADDVGGGDPGVWSTGDQPKYAWWDLDHELVAGETMSPLTRAAYLADTASPLTAWGTEGLEVINCDVSLTLARDPVGTMLGLAARDFVTGPGTASGSAVMHDRSGPVGLVSVVALPYPATLNAYGSTP